MPRAWLSLGSNVDPSRHLALALAALRERFGRIVESPWYRTQAIGFEGPDFINLVVGIDTELPAIALDAWLHALEDQAARDRSLPRFASRTLDVDVVLYDELAAEGPGHLQLPRAELAHAFVLRPLCDLVPDLVPPDGDPRTLAERWSDLEPGERAGVSRIDGRTVD